MRKKATRDFYDPISLYDVPLPRYVKATHCEICHKVTSMTFTDGKERDPHTDIRLKWIPWCACAKGGL